MSAGRVRSKRFDDCRTPNSANRVQNLTGGRIRIASRPIETRSDLVILFCEGRGAGGRLKNETLKWPAFTARYETPSCTGESPEEEVFFRFKNLPVQSATLIPCRAYMSRGPPADRSSRPSARPIARLHKPCRRPRSPATS
jgi:hypothetical protein